MKNAITEISGEPAFAAPRAFRAIAAGCFAAGLCVLLCACTTFRPGTGGVQAADGHQSHVIVQAADVESARRAVEEVGGEVTHTLEIIRAVGAGVSREQLDALEARPDVHRVFADREVELSWFGGSGKDCEKGADCARTRSLDTAYPSLIGAARLHELGIDGRGVTIAFLDTGHYAHPHLTHDRDGRSRGLGRIEGMEPLRSSVRPVDHHGHGSHVASVALSSGAAIVDGEIRYNGVAPNARLVAVRVFDTQGKGRYTDVIHGLDLVLAAKDSLDIRVLNLSFSADPRSRYWDDPLNQAVMEIWRAGIVVVAAAGNRGPAPMTIGVPGNVPYVITVGAMTDNYTPDLPTDDYLASFSSTGPTTEGFVKPEVVAPGGHMLGLMRPGSTVAMRHPEYRVDQHYYQMSGTSQAAAAVSGVVALILQQEPGLTPDDVKCRLITSARPAIATDGTLAYTVFQQGAGLVDATGSVLSEATGCANRGLDLAADLAGTVHFGGRAQQRPDRTFYLMEHPSDPSTSSDLDGYTWDATYFTTSAYLWSEGYLWTEGILWSEGFLWTEGYLWTEDDLWSEGYLWTESLVEPLAVGQWVSQE